MIVVLLGSTISLAAAFLFFARPARLISHFLVLIGLLLSSSGNMQMEKPGPSDFALNNASVLVIGKVSDWPARGQFNNRFPIELGTVVDTHGQHHHSRGVLIVTEMPVDTLAPGSVFGCMGLVDLPDLVRNPGGFDERRYLRQYQATFTVRCDSNSSVATRSSSFLVSRYTAPLRTIVRDRIQASVPDSTHWPLFEALLLGDRSGLSQETKRHFQVTGLMHVLAVSGLHVMLVAMITFVILRQALLRMRASWRMTEWTRLIFSSILLITYCLLSGATPSIVRASVMAFIFMSSNVAGRLASSINNLSLAGLLILLFDPRQLLQAGFQLSFAAVLSIVTIAPQFRRISGPAKYVAGPTLITLAATLGTAPVLLKHFGSFSISGFVLNPVAIPLTAMVLLSGILTVVCSDMVFGHIFGISASFFADVLTGVTHWGHNAVRYEIFATYPFDITWLVILAVAIAISRWHRIYSRGRDLRLVLSIVSASVLFSLWNARSPSLDVVFLDVGQGDAALVRTPCGENFVVDTGPGSINYSFGARIIHTTARTFGIRSFDAIIISHPHSDHLGGLTQLLEMMPVKKVVTNGHPYDSELYRSSAAAIKRLNITHSVTTASEDLPESGCIGVRIFRTRSTADANDASIVLRIDYGNTSFLFTGDSEEKAERSLVDEYATLLSSNVVKVAHHGSRTSSSPAFVSAATALHETGIAVISSGRNNRFGHPDSSVVDLWRRTGYTVVNTASHRAVWLRSDGNLVQEVGWE